MRKFSFLVGTLGGALAGYLLSKPKLVDELTKAKSAEEAAKKLGQHLQRDGKKLAREVKQFVQSDDVQRNVKMAKDFAQRKLTEAKEGMAEFMKEEGEQIKRKVQSKVRRKSF